MRIDKFLKVSRILKRRTVAQEACGEEKVLLNGKTAKPSSGVKIGDVIEILYASGSLKVRVLNVKETIKKEERYYLSSFVFVFCAYFFLACCCCCSSCIRISSS